MATKKKVKSPQKKTVAKEGKKLLWLGAERLMSRQVPPEERNLILLTAGVLGISPFGINILGNQPYMNKLGREQKARQYDRNVGYKYNWIQRAKNDEEKAICECKLVSGEKELIDWITGECSPASTKMRTLKGYQNHIAQTRAKNRAIWEAFGVRIHEEMMTNIEKYYQNKQITGKEITQIQSILSTSVEEIENNQTNKTTIAIPTRIPTPIPIYKATSSDIDTILKLSDETGTDVQFNPERLTKEKANKIIASLMEKQQKKNGNS